MLNLSAKALSSHRTPHDLFELNKFQHQQVELQEELRQVLRMRIDLPLKQGLAKPGASPREDALLFDYRLLWAMDKVSLALLCSEDLFPTIEGFYDRPGGREMSMQLHRMGDFRIRLDPWPFGSPRLEFPVPYRRLGRGMFRDQDEFRRAYDAAERGNVMVFVEP